MYIFFKKKKKNSLIEDKEMNFNTEVINQLSTLSHLITL